MTDSTNSFDFTPEEADIMRPVVIAQVTKQLLAHTDPARGVRIDTRALASLANSLEEGMDRAILDTDMDDKVLLRAEGYMLCVSAIRKMVPIFPVLVGVDPVGLATLAVVASEKGIDVDLLKDAVGKPDGS